MRLEREPRPRCVDADPTVDEILDTFACRDPRCPCNAPRRGREMKTHCPTHRDTHPSLSVSAKNGVTQVHCFAGCAQSATWDEVKRQVLGRRPGLYGDGNLVRLPHSVVTQPANPPDRSASRDEPSALSPEASAAGTDVQAIRVWNQTQPDSGRVAAYLRSRGLSGQVPDVLRFHPELYYSPSQRFPAMVAAFRKLDGTLAGVHRTYLDPLGDGKAPLDPAKKFLGKTQGAAIRLAELEDDTLTVTEGIETGLAVMQATGRSVWATGSASGMASLELPSVACLDIWADHDDAGVAGGAHPLAERATRQGCRVFVIVPDQEGRDWLDVLVEDGGQALRRAREDAVLWLPAAATDDPEKGKGAEDLGGRGGGAGLAEIRLRVATADTAATWYLTLAGAPELTLSTRQLRSWPEVELACNDKASVPGWRPEGKYEWKRIVDQLIREAIKEKVDEEFTEIGNFRRILAHFCHNPESYPQILDQGGVLQEGEHLYFRGDDLVSHIQSLPGNKITRSRSSTCSAGSDTAGSGTGWRAARSGSSRSLHRPRSGRLRRSASRRRILTLSPLLTLFGLSGGDGKSSRSNELGIRTMIGDPHPLTPMNPCMRRRGEGGEDSKIVRSANSKTRAQCPYRGLQDGGEGGVRGYGTAGEPPYRAPPAAGPRGNDRGPRRPRRALPGGLRSARHRQDDRDAADGARRPHSRGCRPPADHGRHLHPQRPLPGPHPPSPRDRARRSQLALGAHHPLRLFPAAPVGAGADDQRCGRARVRPSLRLLLHLGRA